MNEAFQVSQQGGDVFRRRWYKGGVAGACAANPVLRAPQFSRLFALATYPIEQMLVRLAQQPNANGQTLGVLELLAHKTERAQVVGHFLYVGGVGHHKTRFAIEQVGQGGLGTFDLRGKQGLFTDGAVNQPI